MTQIINVTLGHRRRRLGRIDFGLALVSELRGEPFAEAVALVAEYEPEQVYPGSLDAARPEVAAATQAGLGQFAADARTLRIVR